MLEGRPLTGFTPLTTLCCALHDRGATANQKLKEVWTFPDVWSVEVRGLHMHIFS